MNKEMAETLVRTGPGTPMGNLMRRYWVPILLASEVAEPDGPPVRAHILGESSLPFATATARSGWSMNSARTAVRPFTSAATRRTASAAPITA